MKPAILVVDHDPAVCDVLQDVKAALAASTKASSRCRPTICIPTGKPLVVKPAGTEATGWPVKLNGNQNDSQ